MVVNAQSVHCKQSQRSSAPQGTECLLRDGAQAEMEELLFDIMRSKGFGDQYVRRYRMVTAFHLQRRPLIVFICGTACTGESALVSCTKKWPTAPSWEVA